MVPARGFVLSRQFNGFVNEAKHATVLVSVLPQPIDSSVKAMRRQNERSKEMKDFTFSEVERASGKGYWMEGTHSMRDTLRRLFILLFGDSRHTIFVNASLPENEEKTKEELRLMMRSTVYDTTMKEDASELIDFSLNLEGTCLKEARYSKGGMLYSCDGLYPTGHPDGFSLIAGSSVRPKRIVDRAAYVLNRLMGLPGLDSLIQHTRDTIVIDKLPGYALRATGTNRSGDNVEAYLVVLFEGDLRYYLLGGVCTANAAAHIDELRRVTGSFKRKKH